MRMLTTPPGKEVCTEKRRKAWLRPGFSPAPPLKCRVANNDTKVCTSASGNSRFSFFLSGWKDGVPQGRRRLYRHLFQLHRWRGREGQRQRRPWRFGREASTDRWLGEWISVATGPRGERSSQLDPARPVLAAFPLGFVRPGPDFSPRTLPCLFHFCSGDITTTSVF